MKGNRFILTVFLFSTAALPASAIAVSAHTLPWRYACQHCEVKEIRRRTRARGSIGPNIGSSRRQSMARVLLMRPSHEWVMRSERHKFEIADAFDTWPVPLTLIKRQSAGASFNEGTSTEFTLAAPEEQLNDQNFYACRVSADEHWAEPMNGLGRIWDYLRTSFWFVPALMVGGSVVFAAALIEVDSAGSDKWFAQWPRLFGAGAEGARGMMSTIASSMMTVVGVTFSMILVVLTLASSQYTSRVLRNFIRSRVTQVVLGTFAGIFSYCLIVLRTIRGNDASSFVPTLAVFFGFVLALGGVSALMFFIHHVASSIQASSIIATVANDTMLTIDRLFPGRLDQGSNDNDEQPAVSLLNKRSWQAVAAERNGYLQKVDSEKLLRLARKNQTIVRMERAIGDFVVENTPLVSLALEDPPDVEFIGALQSAFNIDHHRMLGQDAAFGVRQIVDMAMRALSPSTNDTTTAVICVDYLSAILSRVACRRIPSSHRYEDGELRVITSGPTFAKLVGDSFDQIRGSAAGNVGIMLRMLGALQTVGSLTPSPSRRLALREQVEWLAEAADRTIESSHERARIDARLTRVREALEREPSSLLHEKEEV